MLLATHLVSMACDESKYDPLLLGVVMCPVVIVFMLLMMMNKMASVA